MTEYKNIIIVETNEAGQPTNLRRLEDGDTISNERLNADVRNAATKIDTVESTANNALAEAEGVSATVYDNSGGWGAGGIDPDLLADITEVSTAFTNFEDNVSGTLASKNTIDSASLINNGVVSLDKIATVADGAILGNNTGGAASPVALTPAQVRTEINVADGATANTGALADKNTIDSASLINNGVVSLDKIATIADGAILGNNTGGAASPVALTPAQVRTEINVADGATNNTGALADKNTIDSASLINNGVVSLGKIATIADGAILGNNTGGAASPVALTPAQVRTEINVADGATANTGALADKNTIDSASLIDTGIVSLDKISTIADGAILGNNTGGAASPVALTPAQVRTEINVADGATANTGALADKNTIDATNLIDDDVISLDKLKHIQVQRILGTTAGGGGVITQLTAGDARTTMGLGDLAVRDDANKLYVNNTSSVAFSGTDSGDAQSVPEDAAMLVIDTAAERIKFKNKINGTRIEDQSITTDQLSNTSVTSDKLATGAALGNLATNSIGFIKLPLINADSFVGNSHPTNGGTMSQFTSTTARNMLGLSAGTVAPPSPDAGDLWYNTDDDELYTYDSGRSHWLGAPHYISMGKTTSTAPGVGHYLLVGHGGTTATTQERGWLVPHDMVITGWRAHTKSTFTGWTFRIDNYSGGTNNIGIVTTGALGAVDTFSDFTLDVDVAAGDILGVPGVTGTSTIDNSTMIIKIQRKGA